MSEYQLSAYEVCKTILILSIIVCNIRSKRSFLIRQCTESSNKIMFFTFFYQLSLAIVLRSNLKQMENFAKLEFASIKKNTFLNFFHSVLI